jgi:hypothetical protein
VLIRSGTFDVLRCLAFGCIVIGIVWSARRFARRGPTVRAELPLARTGDPALGGLRAFAVRVAPVALAFAGLAALAAASRLGHRALVLTDRGGMMHAEPFEFVGSAKDLDPGDVWVVNHTSRAVSCNHMVSGVYQVQHTIGTVIAPGEGLAVLQAPEIAGRHYTPRDSDANTMWLTWER